MIEKYIYYVDKTSDWVGKIACWIIVPLVLGTVYDVFMRYVFQAPTKWAYEMTWMEYGALFMLGGAYGLLHKLHVRVDVIFKNYPARVQLWFDAVVYVLIFIPLYLILIKASISFAAEACMIWEVSAISYWQPYIWPIKTLMPVVFILMFLQAVSELIKIVIHLKKGGDAV
jgi:TRAP-type mannitol/chloroaromatic compound transport system permease small subunit